MKYIRKKSVIFSINLIIFVFISKNLFSHTLEASAVSTNWLVSGKVAKEHAPLLKSVTSWPVVGVNPNCDGTHTAQQYIKGRTSAAAVPASVVPVIKHGKCSVLRGKESDFQTCPEGKELFPDYPTLAAKFDAMITIMKTKPKFKAFFNKVHLNVLNELYEYLMNVYTNFNLQHVGITETGQGQSASLTFNVPLFLENEKETDQNKKTLIINHLVNIIESQINGKIKSIMPNIPHIFATVAGKSLIQNDYSIDLTQFIIKQVEPGLVKYKQLYLEGLVAYLSFFQEFTSYLQQPHPKKAQHFTAFVHIAETINKYIYGSTTADDENSDSKKQMQQLLAKMNPPLFTFNYDDIRALKIIPQLAKTLSPNSDTISWPAHIVKAAENETFVSNHPIAFFKDEIGNVVKKSQATRLYVVLQSGANFFQEEVLAQPAWLNNWSGVSNILAACFGDFSKLLGLNILDPCMEALIQNAVDIMNGHNVNEKNSFVSTCQNFLTNIKNLDHCSKQAAAKITSQQSQLLAQQTGDSSNNGMGSPSSEDNGMGAPSIDNSGTESLSEDNDGMGSPSSDDSMGTPSLADLSDSLNQ